MNDRIILFFYVDDIIILYHPDYQSEFEKLERQLIKLYSLRQIGNVKWFLGIRVERVLAAASSTSSRTPSSARSALNSTLSALMEDTLQRLSHPLRGCYLTMAFQSYQIPRPINAL
jgi:hypothetical protein